MSPEPSWPTASFAWEAQEATGCLNLDERNHDYAAKHKDRLDARASEATGRRPTRRR